LNANPSRFRQIIGIDGLMAVLIFALSLSLLAAGAASGYASLDLLPTSVGVLYALAGAVAVCAAVVTFAIGVAIRRIDRLAKQIGHSVSPAPGDITPASKIAQAEEVLAAPATEAESTESVAEAVPPEDESPININRAGHLPSLEAIETSLETPEAWPSLVGRYSSGGANYKIFADGSIEAESPEGTFKFASMSDFKRRLAEPKARENPATD
jgi:hypothetical protein